MVCRDGATAGRLTPDQKAGGSNPSWVEDFFWLLLFLLLFLLLSLLLSLFLSFSSSFSSSFSFSFVCFGASRLPDSGPDLEGMETILQIQT